MFGYVLGNVTHDEQSRAVLAHVAVALPGGGFLALAEGVSDRPPGLIEAHVDRICDVTDEPWALRGASNVTRSLDGLKSGATSRGGVPCEGPSSSSLMHVRSAAGQKVDGPA
ncbi:hypothetical protein GCM10009550_39380 [Actinocorallia libanotica]|uniref:Uncharacterized protein n=1 Tax=Actinocorallia libanotica TaxID=46162 RepID=A0ABP4BUN5_9ACTN